ncbi:ABC transporter substrate-binding protein [Pseudogemmobacter blasticus]|uniref:Branched-chain amino acid ABC transporter substrate-binding protein n=1 Tax=Fuscovulum blasticum DSM 2131 TaxID=1188250 RepID=A0A2T4JA45_FUSBL|nr:ABC transporter substrate-binding protein [Fuscovulum blasticum]PTE14780.1 branched-chain amino acid ABC transporter substrate-binding protein [Fuscovulum blasticum DSM 2131]
MKKLFLAASTLALTAGVVSAEDVKLGTLLGITGPIESISPNMFTAADMAIKEVNDSGKAANGWVFQNVRADSTCIDAAAASAAAERLVTVEGVKGIIGGDCSGVTRAVLTNVAMPNGIVMISPSATSPALSTDPDDGLFFRTVPSDAREGQVMADVLEARGVKSIALTYSNSDYGKGLAEAIANAFTAKGGTITINASHDDGKADYSAEVGALASAGGDVLVVAGYIDQGGKGIIQAAVDTGAFTTFGLPGGMYGDSLVEAIGPALNGSFGQHAASTSEGYSAYLDLAKAFEPSFDGSTNFAATSYDAAALIMLAMQAANSTDPKVYKDKVIEIANGPADGSGTKIKAGELGKALELIAAGTAIDYDGATGVTLIDGGDASGTFAEDEIKDGKWEIVGYR